MGRRGRSEVRAARVDGVRTGDAIEEQQALGVVHLVLDGDRLEGVGLDEDPLPGDRQLTAHGEPTGPGHVAGEVGDRHAPLPAAFASRPLDDVGVAEDEESVAGPGLGVTGDVHAEHAAGDADLLGRQPDAPRRNRLCGNEVRGQENARLSCFQAYRSDRSSA